MAFISFFKNIWKKILGASVLGVALVLIVSYIYALHYQHRIDFNYQTILATIVLSSIIVEGIQLINKKIDKEYSWISNPKKRFWVQLVAYLVFVLTMLSIFGTIITLFVAKDPYVNIYDLIIINSVGIVFISIYVSIELIVFMLNNWRGSMVEIEKFRKKDAEAKFESLKNQLSPHFLFNNLNTLYGLIKENTSLASDYLLRLSEIYRYVLKIKDLEVVSLKEEIKFIKDYVFLLSTRYGSNFNVEFLVNGYLLNEKFLPPFTLQLLIENAEKHNVIDDEQIMNIRVFSEKDEYIVVENNLLVQVGKTLSTNVGLENLESRYRFLTDKKVFVTKSKDKFVVKVPLLDISQIEL